MKPEKKRYTAREITVCGVFGALSVLAMLAGNIIPLATFVLPAIAGMLLIPPMSELGSKFGYLIYAVVCVLSALLCADKEMCFMFIFLLGYYPILKQTLDKIKRRSVRVAVKFLIFNAAVLLAYSLLFFVIKPAEFLADYAGSTVWFYIAMLILGNFTFWVYDSALKKVIYLYNKKYRVRIVKSIK